MRLKSPWTVASRLRLLSIMIVLSGVIGVVGAVGISKGARMHEFNTLHLKHNYLFSNEVLVFSNGETQSLAGIKEQLAMVREQPVNCLAMLGPPERAVIVLVGTGRAITICEEDIDLADRTLAQVTAFEDGTLSRAGLIASLRDAEHGFNQHSIEFEPLVERTVNWISRAVVAIAIFKAIFVGVCGWLMARGVNADYKKLVKTEASLEVTNSELQNFVYRTSHDFKSPLLGIKSMAQFVEEDIRSGNLDEALSNMQRIHKNAVALEDVVTNTLRLAKADLSINRPEPVALRAIGQEIENRLSAFADERNVRIKISDRAAELTVQADRNHLLAAIENLVTNGIKYSSDERPDSFVEIDATLSPAGNPHIVVRDNGIGIPPEFQADAFEMFKQFHPERSEGSGLGMYIVKRSVERLDGKLSLESSSQGTNVTMTLPAATAA